MTGWIDRIASRIPVAGSFVLFGGCLELLVGSTGVLIVGVGDRYPTVPRESDRRAGVAAKQFYDSVKSAFAGVLVLNDRKRDI